MNLSSVRSSVRSFVDARIQIIFLSSISVDLDWHYSGSMLVESTIIICAFALMTISYSSSSRSILMMICLENQNKPFGYHDHLFIIEERVRFFKGRTGAVPSVSAFSSRFHPIIVHKWQTRMDRHQQQRKHRRERRYRRYEIVQWNASEWTHFCWFLSFDAPSSVSGYCKAIQTYSLMDHPSCSWRFCVVFIIAHRERRVFSFALKLCDVFLRVEQRWK